MIRARGVQRGSRPPAQASIRHLLTHPPGFHGHPGSNEAEASSVVQPLTGVIDPGHPGLLFLPNLDPGGLTMTEIRDCWRRDLSLLSPQQRRSAGYALRLLSLPRDPIAGRLDANRLGLLWDMLQPLFEPRHLIDYLRPPQGVADIVHQDDDVVELLNSCDLADCAVEMLDTGDLSDYAPPADAPPDDERRSGHARPRPCPLGRGNNGLRGGP